MNITTPWEVDLDGIFGMLPSRRLGGEPWEIQYVGTARRQLDGTYRVLAKIPHNDGTALVVAEVRLTF